MNKNAKKYCLDSNVLIEAWQKYYSPKFCPDYWDVFNELGNRNIIFLSQEVFKEITRTDDDLATWLKKSGIPVYIIDRDVTDCLESIFNHNPSHKKLVDNTKGRSLADPWVIAHALKEKATLVTKEEKITAINTTKIKIPNVCENMGIECINDFQLIERLNIQFGCHLGI